MPCDYKKYPPNWKTEIVPRILKRAKNRCEICKLDNKQIVYSAKIAVRVKGKYKLKAFWFQNYGDLIRARNVVDQDAFGAVRVVLTVAHLDHDAENWDVKDERLMAMCQHCHLNYDASPKMQRIIERARENAKKTNI